MQTQISYLHADIPVSDVATGLGFSFSFWIHLYMCSIKYLSFIYFLREEQTI